MLVVKIHGGGDGRYVKDLFHKGHEIGRRLEIDGLGIFVRVRRWYKDSVWIFLFEVGIGVR